MRRGSELLASMGRRLMSAPVVATLGRDLLDDIREDWIYNGEDWTRPGFRALVMYRFGARLSQVSSGVIRLPLKLVYRFLHRRVRNHYGIELHHTAKIGQRVVLAGQAAIAIHELAEIGNECIINQGVTIGADAESLTDDAPKLGKGVTLGAGAVVVGNVRIGDGAKIGPNAVVTMDVPAGSLAIAPRAQVIQPGGFNETNKTKAPPNEPEELSFGQRVEAKYAAAQANGPSVKSNGTSVQPNGTTALPMSKPESETSVSTTRSYEQKVEDRHAARAS